MRSNDKDKYLRRVIENNDGIEKEVDEGMRKAGKIFNMMKKTFLRGKYERIFNKIKIVKKIVILYSSRDIRPELNEIYVKIENRTRRDVIKIETYRQNN